MANYADDHEQVANGRGGIVERQSLAHLAMGTMVTRDIKRARQRYERFFGLECVDYAPGRMMCRDRRAKHLMQAGSRNFFVLNVAEAEDIARPQTMANHWGFSVANEAEVDRIRTIAVARAEDLGFARIHPATHIHGSYSFYMYDDDSNWWEVEYRRGATNDQFFSRTDWNSETYNQLEMIDPALAIAHTQCDVLGDEAFMTHGTSAVIDCIEARPFYEDILGLRTVTHVRPSNCSAGGGDFGFIGITSGKRIQDQRPDNRFVILRDNDEAIVQAHARVQSVRDAYGVLAVSDIAACELGGVAFMLRTRDQIWFELSSAPRETLVAMFDKG